MNADDSKTETEQPFISHLIELRSRILVVVLWVSLVFLGLMYFANDIYTYLATPLLKHMPANSQMVAIDVATPFTTPLKLTFVVALFVTVPVLLYEFWAFIAPGLYRHERRMILPLLVASTTLFYLGAAFAYYVVFPLIFQFLTATAPVGVAMMTDIAKYFDFVLTLFVAFGAAFQVPVLTIVLVWMGIVSRQSLVEQRPYVIVGVFVIAMFLTPPDALSQLLLALPMCLLFELGLLCAIFWEPKTDRASDLNSNTIARPGDISDK